MNNTEEKIRKKGQIGNTIGPIGVVLCVPGLFLLAIGILAWNTERSYMARVEKLRKNAKEIPAKIIKSKYVSSGTPGQAGHHSRWIVVWRPIFSDGDAGEEITATEMAARHGWKGSIDVTETVFESECKGLHEGKRVTVWYIDKDRHFVKERLDYHQPQHALPYLIPAVFCLAIGITMIISGVKLGREAKRAILNP
ncbi:MAG: hypothetical protein SVW57_01845 [Thermodesulfobacteriota bacterium]|nr:hypothetical protein [Thermodesulfobacteriota bacterium]